MADQDKIPYIRGFEEWQNLGYPAEGITALLMTLTAPNELLDRPDFLRTDAENFTPFDYSPKSLQNQEKRFSDLRDSPKFLSWLHTRWSLFEDSLAEVCCTEAGADGVVAVSVRFAFEDPIQNPGEDIHDWLGRCDPTKPTQIALIAKNAGVSEEDQSYIRDIMQWVQTIGGYMGLAESREKYGRITKMLQAVIRQCRKAIEENIQQHGNAISALESFPLESLRKLAEKIPFSSIVHAKDGYCSLSRTKLPIYSAETHREWMLATFTTLQNIIKDLLKMYCAKPSSIEVDLSKLEEVLLRAHSLVYLAPSSHLLEHFDKTQNTFKIRSYLLKISSRIRAVHTLCFICYAGYIFDYLCMGVEFIPPQKQAAVNLKWDDMKSAIATLKRLQSTVKDLPPNRQILVFSKKEERRLEKLWKSEKVKRGLRNVPLHAEMQLVKTILETPGCRPRAGYIAVSKRCCFLCTLFLELWNECIGYYSQSETNTPKEERLPIFAIAGTHGKCYYRWIFPRVEVANTPLGKRIHRSLAYVAYGMVATVMFTEKRAPKIGRQSEGHLRRYLPSDSNLIRGMKDITKTKYDGTESLRRFEDEYGHLFSILDPVTELFTSA